MPRAVASPIHRPSALHSLSKIYSHIRIPCPRSSSPVFHTRHVLLLPLLISFHSPHPGNLPELFQSQAGAPDFKWQEQYGGVVRIKGALGVSIPVYLSIPHSMTPGFRKIDSWSPIPKLCNIYSIPLVGDTF